MWKWEERSDVSLNVILPSLEPAKRVLLNICYIQPRPQKLRRGGCRKCGIKGSTSEVDVGAMKNENNCEWKKEWKI